MQFFKLFAPKNAYICSNLFLSITTNMKKYLLVVLFFILLGFSACETVINPQLNPSVPLLTIDAFITNEAKPQTIRLTKSIGFLDNKEQPPAIAGATIQLADNKNNVFNFIDEKKDGNYTWQPTAMMPRLGEVGTTFKLSVTYNNETFVADSKINRVPTIDSMGYEFRKVGDFGGGTKDGYFVTMAVKDFKGRGDCYRIKSYKNDTLLAAPQQLNLSYDGVFNKGSSVNDTVALKFIFPILNNVNDRDKPYKKGDKCKVEILSLTEPTFDFLILVQEQQTNGGLFATPPANVPTNFKSLTPNSKSKVVGWFCTSAVNTRSIEIK